MVYDIGSTAWLPITNDTFIFIIYAVACTAAFYRRLKAVVQKSDKVDWRHMTE
uniref:Uncharacterized protein n=1 Tax=Parascaris equorum TaxID=6256 RepID=A0A914RZB3_PAREQ